jgi:hypothetical protein
MWISSRSGRPLELQALGRLLHLALHLFQQRGSLPSRNICSRLMSRR